MALRDLFLKPRPDAPETVAAPASSAGAPRPAAASVDPNPYLNARRSWNDYSGGIAHSRRLWQMMAFTASLTSLGAVGGLIYVASTAKFVPYVVRISDVGQPVAVGPAMPAPPIDPRVVEAEVASFITDARTVTSDYDLEKKDIFRIYSMLRRGDLAQRKINEWFSANADASPFAKAQKETVNVQISSVIAQSEHSWQVDWIETTFVKNAAPPTTDDTPPSPDGSTVASSPQMSAGGVSEHWRALVTLDYRPHNKGVSDKEIRANPMGIYVSDLSWSKVQ